ncbi:phosphate regulon sensor histidine kinase PhoR [Variovorax sp. J22G21]|uniref:phosphate regulon sensor histidine kinase PhoR n=1 Tax=Variovorax fucosicus TaxID=3053517 RepID=UPI00257569A5|nr:MULTISPECIES: phosphate regulon sensor histidine kinase PhoR [unclassified Variovorax]MDM0041522.1 phosphate regulon sensor histidine kinase PhoR [Variovorax sp. J22R193]MDM0057884.1 phosphate regulon sensor histidine kinase PhoR [Variovorax sp. J22G47]MDM0060578.1 phosphate regulon sensor histidine kinase PhoR [Variovorax sp. J22G21]
MPFRIATFLIASCAGAAAASAILGLKFAWAGAWLGALLWLLLDAWRAGRLLAVLRSDVAGLPSRGPGIWGELSERIRKLLREREQQTRQAEDRLQEFLAAIQASPNGVVLLDEQGRIEWCNQTAATQFGIDAERDMLQHLANLVRDPAFVAYLASWNYSRDVLINGQGGTQRRQPVRLSVQVHPYAGNRRMLLTRDITALEQAETMRRDFVANVSHEIRTPLTVLAGFVETLQNLPLDAEERARYLRLMGQQSSRMEMLVNDLLTLSRLEGSAAPPPNQWIRMRALLVQCEDEGRGLSGRLAPQGHRLSFALDADSEIAGASTELQSAMSNLLSNAIRYTPGGGQVAVSWKLLPDGRGEYSVRDSGPGIAAEHIPRLTERFYRVDRSRSRETGGTGLGLAIVKHIAQRHGAELQIESTLGQGSKFALVFPAARVREARERVS